MTQEQKDAIYNAFLKSAIDMGDNLKNLSWFGKNKEKTMTKEQDFGYIDGIEGVVKPAKDGWGGHIENDPGF